MPDPVTARAFHHAEGLSDWRVCDGGASAWFDTPDLATGLRFALAVAAGPSARPPARPRRARHGRHGAPGTFRPAPDGLSTLDVAAARAVSDVAREHGLVAAPSRSAAWCSTSGPRPGRDHAVLEGGARAGRGRRRAERPAGSTARGLLPAPSTATPGARRIHVDVWVPTTMPRHASRPRSRPEAGWSATSRRRPGGSWPTPTATKPRRDVDRHRRRGLPGLTRLQPSTGDVESMVAEPSTASPS